MSLTTGFLVLFFTIVIPGFLFLRSYYYGDFSKQFNPSDNITKQLLFGIIPGSIIQMVCFLFGKLFGWINIDSTNVLMLFETVNNQKISQDTDAQELLTDPIKFLYYLLIVYAISFISGGVFSRLIRASKLDKRSKILRFKNQWYYIFSGEIFDTKKFKSAANILGKAPEKGKNQVVELSKVSVLINNGGRYEFYSGYLVDYNLLSSDPSKLDNIYLMNANRHKQTELKNHNSELVHPYINEKKTIPGEVFVLNMCNMVNINVSYLLTEKKYAEQNKWLKRFLRVWNTLLITLAIFTLYPIFVKVSWIDFEWYTNFHNWSWWLDKVLLFALSMSILGIPIADKDEQTERYYFSLPQFFVNLFALIGFLSAFWLVYVYI